MNCRISRSSSNYFLVHLIYHHSETTSLTRWVHTPYFHYLLIFWGGIQCPGDNHTWETSFSMNVCHLKPICSLHEYFIFLLRDDCHAKVFVAISLYKTWLIMTLFTEITSSNLTKVYCYLFTTKILLSLLHIYKYWTKRQTYDLINYKL